MRCLGCSLRCPCNPCACTCCLSNAERSLRTASDALFDTVNTETNCCGWRDEELSRTETMLLLSVLKDKSRNTMQMHGALIEAIISKLRDATAAGTDGGAKITRDELRTAVIEATSAYQLEAISAIAGELARDYEALAAHPLAMDRGDEVSVGKKGLLPKDQETSTST